MSLLPCVVCLTEQTGTNLKKMNNSIWFVGVTDCFFPLAHFTTTYQLNMATFVSLRQD